MELKYIMLNDGVKDLPILFPADLTHKSVAEGTLHRCGRKGRWTEIVSAGFVYFHPNQGRFYVMGEIGNAGDR